MIALPEGRSIYNTENEGNYVTITLLYDLDVSYVFHDNTFLRDVLDYTEDDQVPVVLMNPPYGGSEKAEVKNHFPSDLASSETADYVGYHVSSEGKRSCGSHPAG